MKPADVKDTIEHISIFHNGHQTKHDNKTIATYNTCAFDSIFAVYACLYFDSPNFREHLDVSNLLFYSKFTALVQLHFETFSTSVKSTSQPKLLDNLAWNELYEYRNIILNEIFSHDCYKQSQNLTNSGAITYINCKTGIGRFYFQLCIEMSEIIASSVENKICINCETIKGKIRPFLTVNIIGLDLKNIQESIDVKFSKKRLCMDCKTESMFSRVLNNILALEVEQDNDIQYQTKISLQHLTHTINVGKPYKLIAVVQFDPALNHFVSHVKRKNGEWKMT